MSTEEPEHHFYPITDRVFAWTVRHFRLAILLLLFLPYACGAGCGATLTWIIR